jgi:hypothetical protein
MPVIPALGRPKQEDLKFKSSLDYTNTRSPKIKNMSGKGE